MAQHDFVINNQGFPAFRADLNDFLSAVKTTHSGSSLPSGAAAGTIWLDTSSATVPLLKYYDGADNILLATINHTTNTVTFSGVATDLVNDLTPQLGGNLDTNTHSIVTTSNANVKLYPNGSGVVEIGGATNSGRIQLNCESNSHGIKLASPPHSAAQSYTLTFPSTAPSDGKVLQTDGSGNLSFATVGGDGTVDWDTTVKTSGFTATANKGFFCNTTSAAFTVTLPATPSAGDEIVIVDYAGTFATNKVTLGRNSSKIEGASSDKQLSSANRKAVRLVYIDSTQGWLVYSAANETATAIDPLTYSVDFLVIAGGGGGGFDAGGGGGAGGYRNSYSTESSGGGGSSETELTFTPGTVYTVTVGAGGAGGNTTPSNSTNGSNSSISGTGIATITSTGGGKGAGASSAGGGIPVDAGSGGSGGGGGYSGGVPGAAGTANQGFAGQNFNNPGGGGGGGAAEAGGTDAGREGGDGLASSITGSSVFRGGGGAGGAGPGNASGGNGGGGAGGDGTGNPAGGVGNGSAGTANTGGGGGGANGNGGSTGAAGGSGVVILRMPTANYSGTTTGSPTVSTSGSDTILVYNASGSYTG